MKFDAFSKGTLSSLSPLLSLSRLPPSSHFLFPPYASPVMPSSFLCILSYTSPFIHPSQDRFIKKMCNSENVFFDKYDTMKSMTMVIESTCSFKLRNIFVCAITICCLPVVLSQTRSYLSLHVPPSRVSLFVRLSRCPPSTCLVVAGGERGMAISIP